MPLRSRGTPRALAVAIAPAILCAAVASHDGVRPAAAQPSEQACRVIELEVTPTDDLQMVAWIEEPDGTYIDTIYITHKTGRYGLGNRPGIMEFNSGPLWPYGRRTTTFPVWAHRHGFEFPLVEFQDGAEENLSHPIGQSSRERFYCRPIQETEPMWDAQSCASTVYTDKGKLSDTEISRYPPRSDVVYDPERDHESVETMISLNPFDAVSKATPPGNEPFEASWAVPFELPNGEYVLWLEVSREFDQNEFYDYPEPQLPAWGEYGVAYRGQPSLVYRAEFSLSDELTVTSALDYVGYGDPDGRDGELRPPDDTITQDVDGSGASRLLVMTDGGEPYRLKVSAYPSPDETPPEAAGAVEVDEVTGTSVAARFMAPGDDGLEGEVAGYEIRYLAGRDIDASNFHEAEDAKVKLERVAAGQEQAFVIEDLVPRTNYSIGIRAFDECRNVGPITVFRVTTPRPQPGQVDACFVATAAHGSLLAGEVRALRRFRDAALRTHLAGELAVEGYYTFGPLLARAIAPSETLRRLARAALAPAVERVRQAGF
ncbi:MAG TPA: fibronectin type III domain-containing protein [Kofleriaceae bacterium]|nr:fibronectin type III domain-containing protein [Kofleriaceae bacterium]